MFNEWFSWANGEGIAMASTQDDGQILVLTVNEEWVSFEEMLKRHPLSAPK
ncbi:hypothetical protein [Stenomitos frigidus]|uniref:hypothetical protein n=1 Tax=Stenomitos frigidus TaxID=1886765 RepID=UPI0015E69207|nr:hypothetical protein [Stenomitos frigidus]